MKIIRLVAAFIFISLFTNPFARASEIPSPNKIPISNVKTDNKVAAIACNVYEGENLIPEMLDVLDKYNVKVTFFMGGVWVKRNPEILLMIKDRGHDIQNHGYNHRLPTRLDNIKNIDEIKRTEQLIYDITGIKTNLFEPPSGDFNPQTVEIVESLGYKMITWNVDTIDWRKDATTELILSRVSKKLMPGSIILIHPKEVTAKSLESIIKYVQEQGYEITTVTDILSYQ